MVSLIRRLGALLLLASLAGPVHAEEGMLDPAEPLAAVSAGSIQALPDVRDEKLKLGSGNWVAVPIPVSNPTFGTGLVAVGAYYYGQTEEQKKVQPASFTGAGGVYTDNKSYAYGVVHQQYWNEDRWRLTASGGYADFKLFLSDPVPGNEGTLDWLVSGYFAQASLSRRIAESSWYLGGTVRYLDITQALNPFADYPEFNVGSKVISPALGATVLFDTRDNPTNAYSGLRVDGEALFSSASAGRRNFNYQSYYTRFRSYHQLEAPLVIAWDVHGCVKSGTVPLWDTCRVGLRGFPSTRYLGKSSLSAQVEARWNFRKRWGMVAFAGGGFIGDATRAEYEDDIIPSYGIGLRFMVMKAQRINLRIDYARSDDSSAWYLGVAEYF
jgi:hypothetical protein